MMAVLMTDVADAGQQAETYHQGRPMTEPGQEMVHTVGQASPKLFDFPRQPFGGLRGITAKLLHTHMPPVIPTPSKTIAPHQTGYVRVPGAKGPSAQDRAAVAYTAVSGVERPDWYEDPVAAGAV